MPTSGSPSTINAFRKLPSVSRGALIVADEPARRARFARRANPGSRSPAGRTKKKQTAADPRCSGQLDIAPRPRVMSGQHRQRRLDHRTDQPIQALHPVQPRPKQLLASPYSAEVDGVHAAARRALRSRAMTDQSAQCSRRGPFFGARVPPAVQSLARRQSWMVPRVVTSACPACVQPGGALDGSEPRGRAA